MGPCWILCLSWASVISLRAGWGEATPLPFNTATESSGDHDLDTPATLPSAAPSSAHMAPPFTIPSILTHGPAQPSVRSTPPPDISAHPSDDPANPSYNPGVEHSLLGEMRSFLRENLALVLLVSILLVSGIFLVCCASAVSRGRKFAAYYPSSFPDSCYVDQRDKAGGEPAFRQVPNRPPNAPAAEPRDSAQQLQQDILTAARKLRPGGRNSQRTNHRLPEDQQSQQDIHKSEEPSKETREEVTPTVTEQEVALRNTEEEVASADIEKSVTPTGKKQEVSPSEAKQEEFLRDTEQDVTPTETDQTVSTTKSEQEATPSEVEQEMARTATGQEVTHTEMKQEVVLAETEQEVACAEAEQEVATTEIEQDVTPTEKKQEVSLSETEKEVTSTETEREETPTETEQVVVAAETEQEDTHTETEQEVVPTETEQEVQEMVVETDLPHSTEEPNKEPEAEQEMRSSPEDTVRLISGETTAF